jgi:thiol-disulfide isomerase/thioredoxin
MRLARCGWMTILVLLWGAAVVCAETTLLDFYSDSCGPCRAMAPAVEEIAREGFAVKRINVSEDRESAATFNVTAVPCFVVIEDGREVDRIVGLTTVERLKVKLVRRPQARIEVDVKKTRPHPAWRYERPEGHRSAVVRIYCQDDTRTRSIGSGVLVRWGKRIVVLTARHVVQDAKKIVVEFCTRKTCAARVLKVDVIWDCAVLDLTDRPEGIAPAEMELGNSAMQREGNRLESCGYGPDGKLACNSGLFLSYKRSTQAQNGPDDWMEISGHARSGDSGGPIFNERGHVVGVLWGTDGQHVIGVQAGRIHCLLDEAVPAEAEQKALVALSVIERRPTPPLPGPEPEIQPVAPLVPVPSVHSDATRQDSARQIFGRKPIPQPPAVVVKPDPEVRQALGDIDAKVGVLVGDRQRQQQAAEKPKSESPSPLLTGLAILAAIILGFVIYFAAASKS